MHRQFLQSNSNVWVCIPRVKIRVTSGDGDGNELSHFYVEVCYDSFRYSKGAEWQLQLSQRQIL